MLWDGLVLILLLLFCENALLCLVGMICYVVSCGMACYVWGLTRKLHRARRVQLLVQPSPTSWRLSIQMVLYDDDDDTVLLSWWSKHDQWSLIRSWQLYTLSCQLFRTKTVNLKTECFPFLQILRMVTLQIFLLQHFCHAFPVYLTFFHKAVNLQVTETFGIVISLVCWGMCRLAHNRVVNCPTRRSQCANNCVTCVNFWDQYKVFLLTV